MTRLPHPAARYPLCPGRRLAALVLPVLLALAFALPAAAAPSFPALTGRVVDQAGLLPPRHEQELTTKLKALEDKTTNQFVIVTLKSLGGYEIRDYGYQLGRHWAIGQKDKNNGVLLIVAPKERKVSIEVGYGLEGTLTDALTKLIIENTILPRFKDGNMSLGIRNGADDLIRAISGEAQQVMTRIEKDKKTESLIVGIIFIIFFGVALFIMLSNLFGTSAGSNRRGRSRGWSSGGGGWSSGGGGFSGGGGSFGGGGSSGSW